MPEVTVTEASIGIIALIVKAGLAESNGEAKRLVQQGAVELAGQKCADPRAQVSVEDGAVLRCGKRGFVRLRRA